MDVRRMNNQRSTSCWNASVRAHGVRLGRPRVRIAGRMLATVEGLTVTEAAQRLGASRSTAHGMMVESAGRGEA